MKLLTDEQKEIMNLFEKLSLGCQENLLWHLELVIEEKKLELPPEESKKETLMFHRGRNRSRYYTNMKISNAQRELNEGCRELDLLDKNWDKLPKDSPIYWDGDKLVGDKLAGDEDV